MKDPRKNPRDQSTPARVLPRRQFMRQLVTALGGPIVFMDYLPDGVLPSALAQQADILSQIPPSKRELTILSDRPLNAETPAHLLDPEVTPNDLHFVRNNGLIPQRALDQDLTDWKLTIDGEVREPREWTLSQLKSEFEEQQARITIECAGNGRAGYYPNASGNQWTLGAVGCAEYRGVRLADVLAKSGLKASAVYIGYYGEDPHLSRDPDRQPISRGVPIEKAVDPHTLLVWEMNGVPLPPEHGYPLRLICPGWPGSTCGKWLRRIWIRDREHDGTKMTGSSYRVPKNPVSAGTSVPTDEMDIITVMPVKSLITRPQTGFQTTVDQGLPIRGHAWSGTGRVQRVDVTFDFGATWIKTELDPAPNRYAWQRWRSVVKLPKAGYYELWARATDDQGRAQPMVVPGWNPKGYLNNAMHRVAVQAI